MAPVAPTTDITERRITAIEDRADRPQARYPDRTPTPPTPSRPNPHGRIHAAGRACPTRQAPDQPVHLTGTRPLLRHRPSSSATSSTDTASAPPDRTSSNRRCATRPPRRSRSPSHISTASRRAVAATRAIAPPCHAGGFAAIDRPAHTLGEAATSLGGRQLDRTDIRCAGSAAAGSCLSGESAQTGGRGTCLADGLTTPSGRTTSCTRALSSVAIKETNSHTRNNSIGLFGPCAGNLEAVQRSGSRTGERGALRGEHVPYRFAGPGRWPL